PATLLRPPPGARVFGVSLVKVLLEVTEGRNAVVVELPADGAVAVPRRRQGEDALQHSGPLGAQHQLAVAFLDPQGHAAGNWFAALSGGLALALPCGAVAVRLHLGLAVAAHELHGCLEEVAGVGGVSTE